MGVQVTCDPRWFARSCEYVEGVLAAQVRQQELGDKCTSRLSGERRHEI
jgi:hypothetical protein